MRRVGSALLGRPTMLPTDPLPHLDLQRSASRSYPLPAERAEDSHWPPRGPMRMCHGRPTPQRPQSLLIHTNRAPPQPEHDCLSRGDPPGGIGHRSNKKTTSTLARSPSPPCQRKRLIIRMFDSSFGGNQLTSTCLLSHAVGSTITMSVHCGSPSSTSKSPRTVSTVYPAGRSPSRTSSGMLAIITI